MSLPTSPPPVHSGNQKTADRSTAARTRPNAVTIRAGPRPTAGAFSGGGTRGSSGWRSIGIYTSDTVRASSQKRNSFPLDGGRLGWGWERHRRTPPHPDPPPQRGEGEY